MSSKVKDSKQPPADTEWTHGTTSRHKADVEDAMALYYPKTPKPQDVYFERIINYNVV